jgi:hypothetical protein
MCLLSSLFSILVAIITAYASSTFYVRNVKADLRKEYESRFNERKWETYTEFAGMVSRVLEDTKNKKTVETKRYTAELFRFTGSLWIVGSDKVIEAFIDWKQHTSKVSAGEIEDKNFASLLKLAQIIIEMRRDLGYTSDRATAKDLLATFINDIEKYL